MKLTMVIFSLCLFDFAYAANCIDLSGKWEGSCTQTSGQSFNYAVELKQKGCETMTSIVAGDRIRTEYIGGPVNDSRTINGTTTSTSAVLKWSSDGKSLEWTSATIALYASGKVYGEMGNGTETVENDIYKLKSDFTFRGRENGKETKSENIYDCELKRVKILSFLRTRANSFNPARAK